MRLSGWFRRGGRIWRLALIGFVAGMEMGTPFIRMLVLAHLLEISGVGFSAAISAIYATILLVTNIDINRFVFSTPREDYSQAIAAAHGLSLLRGVGAAILAVISAPWLARLIIGEEHVLSIVALAPILFIRSFEHLGPRVAERDYRYGPQLKINLISNLCALVTLVVIAAVWRSPDAILGFLVAQNVTVVLASHWYAATKYELRLRGDFFVKAWRFAYPLMLNGVGLAFMQQGDRMLVAFLFGLQALGLYSTAMMAAWVPISFLIRLMQTVNMATLFNAPDKERFGARLRLFARFTPLIAAAYAITILAFINPGIWLLIGPKYLISPELTAVLAALAFATLVRTEPFTTLLLHEMKTGQLAIINLLTIFGLVLSTGFALYFRALPLMVFGRVIGEALCLGVAVYLTRQAFRIALADFGISLLVSSCLTLGAIVFHLYTAGAAAPLFHAGVLTFLIAAISLSGAWVLRTLFKLGYQKHDLGFGSADAESRA